jgi:hypothetical protein
MVGWSTFRLQSRISIPSDFGYYEVAGEVVLDLHCTGKTDKGRTVELCHFVGNTDDPELFVKHAEYIISRFAAIAIERQAEDVVANCHGWVFTHGAFLLRGEGVQRILEDNGYQLTDNPGSGDIIIYRGSNDIILHTGLVQGILSDGTVIIESKWGIGKRFLHRPEDTPYSTRFEYYHTDRLDHLIQIENVPVDS